MTDIVNRELYSAKHQNAATSLEHGPLVTALILVLRERRLIVALMAIAAVATIVIVLMTPRGYVSTSSFTPQGRKSMSAASGLAAQLGVSLDATEGSESPAFYAELVTSREILRTVLDSVAVPGSVNAGRLIDLLVRKNMDTLRKREAAIDSLRMAVAADVSKKTGVVTIKVAARSAALAQAIDQRLVDELARFNLVGRQSQASAERRFAEARAAEARQHLREAEDALQTFLQQNRGGSSPALEFQRDRFMREVNLRQALYTTLSQAFEQARIDEVRDTPVLTMIEHPTFPAKPLSRGLIRQTIMALIAGFMLGSLIALIKSRFAALRYDDRNGREELGDLWASTKADLGRLVGRRPKRPSNALAQL